MAYSLDLRQRVLAAVDATTATRAAIAERFAVSTSWIRRLVQRRRETGSITPRPHRGGPAPSLGPAERDRLRVLVEQQADATLAELRDRRAAPVGLMTIARALKALRLPLKRSRSGRPSRTGRTSPGRGPSTGPRSRASTRAGGSSSMRRRPRPRWPAGEPARPPGCGPWPPSRTATGRSPRWSRRSAWVGWWRP